MFRSEGRRGDVQELPLCKYGNCLIKTEKGRARKCGLIKTKKRCTPVTRIRIKSVTAWSLGCKQMPRSRPAALNDVRTIDQTLVNGRASLDVADAQLDSVAGPALLIGVSPSEIHYQLTIYNSFYQNVQTC